MSARAACRSSVIRRRSVASYSDPSFFRRIFLRRAGRAATTGQ